MPLFWSSSSGGSLSLTVAASDATTVSKKNAEYLCDGTADNVQIQAANDALGSEGGTIILSDGTFTISAVINLSAKVRLVGQGIEATTITSATASHAFVNIDNDYGGVEQLTFESGSTGQTGLLIQDSRYGYLENLMFTGAFDQALHMNPQTTNSDSWTLNHLWFLSNVISMLLEGTSASAAATQCYANHIVISGFSDVAIDHRDFSDGWTYGKVLITSNTGSDDIGIRIGNATSTSYCMNHCIQNLDTFVSGASSHVISIYPDIVQTTDIPLIIQVWNDESATTNKVTLNSTALKPIYFATRVQDSIVRGLHMGGNPILDSDYGCRVYNDAAVTCTTSVARSIPFNQERYDTDTMHDTSTNNTRITATTAGKYLITGNATFVGNATGIREIYILYNGTDIIGTTKILAPSTSAADMMVSTIWDMAATDYVELYAIQTSGGNLDVSATAKFSPEFMAQRLA